MTYRAQVSIPMFSGVPEDVVTNTLYFQRLDAGDATDVDIENMIDHLTTFYEHCYGNGPVLGVNSMASYMNPAQTKFKLYNLEDATPRPPIREQTMPIEPLKDTTTLIPNEVAFVLSFRSEPVPGVVAGSTRGRIYLGGIGTGFVQTGTVSAFPSIKSASLNEVTAAAVALFNNMLEDEWGWVVHSEKLDQDFAVAEIWADNAFDTQRRRGNKATLRDTEFTPEGP